MPDYSGLLLWLRLNRESLNEELLEKIIKKGLKQNTCNSITNGEFLRSDIQNVRENGFAIDNMESNDGGLCFAVEIFNFEDKIVGSIGQTMISLYYTMDEVINQLGPQIIETGKKISAKLGYTGYQKDN